MALDSVLDSIKEYVNDRLKSPYFASVIGVWIITNRVFVFGVFNFSDDISLGVRILWASQQFQDTHPFGWQWVDSFLSNGFFCIGFGFVAMVILNILTTSGKYIYHHVNKFSIEILYKLKESDWVSNKVYKEVSEDRNNLRSELRNYQDQMSEVRRLIATNSQLEKKVDEINVLLNEKVSEITLQKQSNGILNSEKQELELKLRQTNILYRDISINAILPPDAHKAIKIEAKDLFRDLNHVNIFIMMYSTIATESEWDSAEIDKSHVDYYAKTGVIVPSDKGENIYDITIKGLVYLEVAIEILLTQKGYKKMLSL